jgi:hypothetical protein
MKRITLLAIVMLLSIAACVARTPVPTPAPTAPPSQQAAASVPADYLSMYYSLSAQLDYELGRAKVPVHSLTFAAELITADSNRGTALLDAQTLPATRLYLDRLKAMGMGGVKLSVQYPLLTPDFPNYARYLEFYRQVAAEVRQRGLQLCVQSSILFANTPFSEIQFDFSSLTFEKYKAAARVMAATIIQELKPDYLVLLAEPDTAAALTGLKEFNDPAGGVDLVNTVLQGLERGKTKVGAGTGAWAPLSYATALARQTAIDFISIHVYPLNSGILQNGRQMAAVAHQNAKGVVISEAWLYKEDNPSPNNTVASSEEVFRRDMYSFWEPLDEKFFKAVVAMADEMEADFMSAYGSMVFFASLDYTPALDGLPYPQLRQQANQAAYAALQAGKLSKLGEFYKDLIAGHK